MSADRLREAAALMRARAEATVTIFSATGVEVPWHSEASLTLEYDAEDAGHIAGMSPAVALAVADWLDVVGRRWTEAGPRSSVTRERASALAVANAYLGAPS